MKTSNWFDSIISRPSMKIMKITLEEYKKFKQEYSFLALKSQRFGQAFCNYFNITDNILMYNNSTETADQYIRKTYIGANAT